MKTVVWAAVRRLPMLVTLVCLTSGIASAQSVPSPWTARDIGAPTLAGSATHASGTFTIDAAGVDIWSSADQFHFVYQAISGDVDISARLASLDPVYSWTNAGVMIRSSLSASAAHAYSMVSSSKGMYFRRRLTNGATTSQAYGPKIAAPAWVRLVRKGTAVTSYHSTDGTTWTKVGASTIALGTTAYVGIAVTSHKYNVRATAVVSNVKVSGAASEPSGTLPSEYRNQDIGGPSIAGSVAYASGRYTIKAAGRDIWDTADQFHYVWKPVTGDVDVVARVASITYAHAWSKAGVMIRESLDKSARHATMLVSYSKGYAFQRRPDPAVYSEHTSGGSGTAPGWVRLVRTGDLFESYRSSNGTSWTRIGTDTIPMGDTVYVGLAVTSHNTGATTTAVIDGFKITEAATGVNKPPVVSITAPANGTQVTAPLNVTVGATASDPENRMASVDFYAGSTLIARDTTAPYSVTWSASTAGTYALTAVAHDADGASSTSSAVSVTVSAPVTTTAPKAVAFQASADHATNVSKYVLKVFAATANPATATALATSDLGKPTPTSAGEITVDRATFFSALAAGNYLATVTAVGSGGQTQSQAVSFTR
jgi:regulation of enolase protein 1 (concanavalin A-like superfamily)